jgi:hypothetical protein
VRAVAHRWLAALFGAVGAVGAAHPEQADNSPSAVSDFARRAALMRERLEQLQGQPAGTSAMDEGRDVAQWFNFPNFQNWNNWANNWYNFPNWGNFR